MKNKNLIKMTTTAILAAMSIVLICYVPSLPVGMVTVTLSAHTPLFISMMISPWSAAVVAIISALGFIIKGLPLDVFIRALTHIVWAVLGAFMFKNLFVERSDFKSKSKWFKFISYSLILNIIHGALECLAVYFMIGFGKYATLLLFIVNVGVITGLHGFADFLIGMAIYSGIFPFLKKQ